MTMFYPAKSVGFMRTPGSQPNRKFGWVRIYQAIVPDESGRCTISFKKTVQVKKEVSGVLQELW